MLTQRADGNQPLKFSYIILMTFVLLGSFVIYLLLPWLFAYFWTGKSSFSSIFTTSTPICSEAIQSRQFIIVPTSRLQLPSQFSTSIAVVDTQTKEVRIHDLDHQVRDVNLVADGDRVWWVTTSMVGTFESDRVTKHETVRKIGRTDSAFLYHGQLAAVESPIGTRRSARLTHPLLIWSGTDWIPHGELLLPESGTVNGQAYGGTVRCTGFNHGGVVHWFCTDGTVVLHTIDDILIPKDSVSALLPETGDDLGTIGVWEIVGKMSSFTLGADARGLIVADVPRTMANPFGSSESNLYRRNDDGWRLDRTFKNPGLIDVGFVSNGEQANIFGLSMSQLSVKIRDLTNPAITNLQIPTVKFGGSFSSFCQTAGDIGTWTNLFFGFVVAFAVTKLMSTYSEGVYEFGNSKAVLGSAIRRVIGKQIDFWLMLLPVLIGMRIYFGSFQQQVIAEQIYDRTDNVFDVLRLAGLTGMGFLVYGLIGLFVISVLEGLSGISPGKWICGIRVVRSTLRPCGIFRALLREIFMIVDTLLGICWLPGAFCLVFTPCRQRIGDLAADTVVIRNGSIAPISAPRTESERTNPG